MIVLVLILTIATVILLDLMAVFVLCAVNQYKAGQNENFKKKLQKNKITRNILMQISMPVFESLELILKHENEPSIKQPSAGYRGIYLAAISLSMCMLSLFFQPGSLVNIITFIGLIAAGVGVIGVCAWFYKGGDTLLVTSAILLASDFSFAGSMIIASDATKSFIPCIAFFIWIIVSRIQYIQTVARIKKNKVTEISKEIGDLSPDDRKSIFNKVRYRNYWKYLTIFLVAASCLIGLVSAAISSEVVEHTTFQISEKKASDDDGSVQDGYDYVEIFSYGTLQFMNEVTSPTPVTFSPNSPHTNKQNFIRVVNLLFFWIYTTFILSLLIKVMRLDEP
ncbi:hypothetical protein [Lapidilactobacillus salsurivasis]